MAEEQEIGKVSDYFAKVGVAAIKMTGSLKVGDNAHFKGHTTDFNQIVESMQINRKEIQEAKKGDEVGIKVKDRVRKHDKVYLVSE